MLGALLLLVVPTTPPPREQVKFDFAWRHALVFGPPPPPPPPPLPPVGPSHCPSPDHWPANKSGVQCSGLGSDKKAQSAGACAVNCCNDQACSVWQFSTATAGGGCWRGACDGGFGHNAAWVGGMRPARVNPPPPAPVPPPPPTPSDHPSQAQTNFDDSKWPVVDLPHDMNMGAGGGDSGGAAASIELCPHGCSGRSYIARQTGWYRKRFTLPVEWTGSHVSVVFEGAFHYSMVYINGVLIGNHTCGYTSFDVPLWSDHSADDSTGTPLKFGGGENVISVYTDATSGTGWWYEGGGLFRHVWLMKRSPIHLTTWGTFVAPQVSPSTITTIASSSSSGGDSGGNRLQATASLNISAVVAAGPSVSATSVTASFEVISDSTGAIVATHAIQRPVAVVAGGEIVLHALVPISAPVQLWTIRSPALYTVRTTLQSASRAAAAGNSVAVVLDQANTSFGFRSLRYDAAEGFHMNEQHVKVRGFCDHNDFANVGVGVPDRLNLYRAQAARSIGGNGRRTISGTSIS
jgi:hypothetical protein